MLPVRVKIGWKAAVIASLGVACVLVAERPMQAAGRAAPLLKPTPLVLKDGRIARVSIHEVPFAPGQADIAGDARASLTDLARAVDTDCFLTAQVIGHIEPGEVAGDTLNAHRLARARADAVQASLIDHGLPAKAIASVWDWQFMVRQPQATLWIFELTAGEDCEGEPLQSDLVAQASRPGEQERAQGSQGDAMMAAESAPAPAAQVAEATPQPISPAPRQQAIVPAIAAAEAVAPPQEPRVETSEARGAPEAKAAQTEPAPAPTAVPRVTRPLPAPEPETTKVAPSTTRQTVAARPTAPARRARETATDGQVERDSDGAWVITFATNSSYFPAGVSRRLRQLLSEIDAENRYQVTLQVAVSGTTKVAGAKSAQEAARYNKWLAERRMERVRQWLTENVKPDNLTITPKYLSDDESRRVVVRLSRVGAS